MARAGRRTFQMRDKGLALGGQVIVVAQAGSPAWGSGEPASGHGPDYQP
jgi:hypothetical protein